MQLLLHKLIIFVYFIKFVSSNVNKKLHTLAVPQKNCPSTLSKSCSGHGFCEKIDTASGRELFSCPSGSLACRVYCRCDFGYGGQSCQYNSTALAHISSSRATQCAFIASADLKVSLSASSMSALIQTFSLAFNPYEISTNTDMGKCTAALNVVSTALMKNPANSLPILTNFISAISSVVENLRLSTSVYNNETEAAVTLATNILLKRMLLAMKPGSAPLLLTSNNLFIKVYFESTINLKNMQLIAPQGLQSISLPASGLNSCGFTGKYATFSLVEWQTNPHVGASQTLNSILSFTAMNITSVNSLGSVSSPPSTPPVVTDPINNAYVVTLFWALPQNWSHWAPNCSLLSGRAAVPCACKLTSFTTVNASFTCPDVLSLCTSKGYSSLPQQSASEIPVNIMKTTNFGVVVASTGTSSAFVNFPTSLSLDTASGTSFFTCFLFCVGVGVMLFALWDSYEHTTFTMNKIVLEKNRGKIPPPEFTIKDTFTTSGVTGQSMVSFSHRPTGGNIHPNATKHIKGIKTIKPTNVTDSEADAEDAQALSKKMPLWEKLKKPVDLLEDDNNSVLYVQALLRNHSMLRMFTYGSLRVTRVLRFVCFCTDIMLMIFVTTAFYSNAFPSMNGCDTYKKYQICLAEKAHWIDGPTLCNWDWPTLKCSLRTPSATARYFVTAGTVVLIVCIIPQTLIKWAFEYVYTKEIVFALQAQGNSETDENKQKEEVFSINPDGRVAPNAHARGLLKGRSSISLTPEERETRDFEHRMKRVLSHCKNQVDSDDHQRNKVVMQHFVDEHLAAHESFFVRNHFFTMDHAKPETLGVLLWAFTLLVTIGLWFFFVVYIYMWLLTSDRRLVFAWGCTFVSAWALKAFAVEFLGVFLMYVLPIVFLRKKLKYIYDVISGTPAAAAPTDAPHAGNESVEEGKRSGHAIDRAATNQPSQDAKKRVRNNNPMKKSSAPIPLNSVSKGHSATAQVASQLGTNAVAKDAAMIILNMDDGAVTKLREVKSRPSVIGGRRGSNWGWVPPPQRNADSDAGADAELSAVTDNVNTTSAGAGAVGGESGVSGESYSLAAQSAAVKSDDVILEYDKESERDDVNNNNANVNVNSNTITSSHTHGKMEDSKTHDSKLAKSRNPTAPLVPSAVRGHTRTPAQTGKRTETQSNKRTETRTPPAKLSAQNQSNDRLSGMYNPPFEEGARALNKAAGGNNDTPAPGAFSL